MFQFFNFLPQPIHHFPLTHYSSSLPSPSRISITAFSLLDLHHCLLPPGSSSLPSPSWIFITAFSLLDLHHCLLPHGSSSLPSPSWIFVESSLPSPQNGSPSLFLDSAVSMNLMFAENKYS